MTIFFCLLSFGLQAQECDNPTIANGDYLHGNNVRAFYMASGSSFYDGKTAQYKVNDPLSTAAAPIATMFAHGLWLGGFAPDGTLHLSASQYGNFDDSHDYYPGPLSEDGTVTSGTCANFDRTWSVYRYQIEAHQADFADNGVVDHPISDILGWPATGNMQFELINGFLLPDNDQAFVVRRPTQWQR